MKRRFFLKSIAASVSYALTGDLSAIDVAVNSSGAPKLVTSLHHRLSTPGRLGFYVDYSERSTLGIHTFYVCRTHGTKGKVSVDYTAAGDPHNAVSGTLTWGDGESGIRMFSVEVDSKNDGEHRIYAQLSNPTGGAALHCGDYTRAYGVIDDGTIASDSDAVFYDSAAASGGDGSQSAPYNSVYTAIANIGGKRYLYGKGTTIPDGTNMVGPYGVTVKGIDVPATRAGESTRLYIRNWPGFTWVVDGDGDNETFGFYADTDESFHTYKGIDFTDLNSTGVSGVPIAGVWYHYGASEGINIEHCTFSDLNGSENNYGAALYGVDGVKVWRSTFNNIMRNGDNTNQNTSGVGGYDGQYVSVQRCEFNNSSSGCFPKRVETVLDVSYAVRFCIFNTDTGIRYNVSGASNPSHSYTIVQGNLFRGCNNGGIYHNSVYGDANPGEKQWWCNNVFDSCGVGEVGAIVFNEAFKAQIFNNIFLNCRRAWTEFQDSETIKSPGVEFADYNHVQGTIYSRIYEWKGVDYSTAAALCSEGGHACNDTQGDPLFNNATSSDYTLQAGSPCKGSGIDGTDKGIYSTGLEALGPKGDGPSAPKPPGQVR